MISIFRKNFGKFFNRVKNNAVTDSEQPETNYFPNGEADIIAGTNEVLAILNNKITREEAKSIFLKALYMSREPKKFDRERLVTHLASYCIHHFSNAQIDKFQSYLTALTVANNIFECSPIQVERDGNGYVW